jgi:GMP synthase (glutamine-hydrolysing)
VAELIDEVARTAGDREVLCGVSGGVDSTVLATLLHESGVNTRLVLVDTGLLRKNEASRVQRQFDRLDMELEVVDASDRFLAGLEGVEDPEEKRAVIGDTFLDEFFSHAGTVEMLAQGTLYPDVIESATSGSGADTIKTHHNRVPRILELERQGRVLEPLSELFKDEVRNLGRSLGLPETVVGRHPFPGPGLGIRVISDVDREKLQMLREADHIFINELKEQNLYDEVWQAFAVLLPIQTVGVMGDERTYEFTVGLRAVTSVDGMTADWAHLPHSFLSKVSNRIINEVRGVNRVVYDISSKPPSTIEWE